MNTLIRSLCNGEMIELELDEDVIYMGMWNRGIIEEGGMTWRNKLRYCWQVLRHGKPFSDEIDFDRKGALELISALESMVHKMNKEE